jgi:hypothetical protein
MKIESSNNPILYIEFQIFNKNLEYFFRKTFNRGWYYKIFIYLTRLYEIKKVNSLEIVQIFLS